MGTDRTPSGDLWFPDDPTMAANNPIQFALVREDPAAELAVLDRVAPKNARVLLVASGGCTALTLASCRPALDMTLLDANQAQLDLVARKLGLLRKHGPSSPERLRLFGVGADDPHSVSGCGNFESLFRAWRGVLDEFIMPTTSRQQILQGASDPATLLSNRYWPVSFEMFFGDAMLEAMFGPEATQHAPKGSYPAYFRRVVERGLNRGDASTNWFLHQVLLGAYMPHALPPFLTEPCHAKFNMVHASMAHAPGFGDFGLIQLSNLFDWMDAAGIDAIVRRLCAECVPGTAVLVRQLNNRAPVEQAFAPAFEVDQRLSDQLTQTDRSLFYERILVLIKQ